MQKNLIHNLDHNLDLEVDLEVKAGTIKKYNNYINVAENAKKMIKVEKHVYVLFRPNKGAHKSDKKVVIHADVMAVQEKTKR